MSEQDNGMDWDAGFDAVDGEVEEVETTEETPTPKAKSKKVKVDGEKREQAESLTPSEVTWIIKHYNEYQGKAEEVKAQMAAKLTEMAGGKERTPGQVGTQIDKNRKLAWQAFYSALVDTDYAIGDPDLNDIDVSSIVGKDKKETNSLRSKKRTPVRNQRKAEMARFADLDYTREALGSVSDEVKAELRYHWTVYFDWLKERQASRSGINPAIDMTAVREELLSDVTVDF